MLDRQLKLLAGEIGDLRIHEQCTDCTGSLIFLGGGHHGREPPRVDRVDIVVEKQKEATASCFRPLVTSTRRTIRYESSGSRKR